MEAESKLPNVIKNRVCKQEMKEYPNLICNHWTSWVKRAQNHNKTGQTGILVELVTINTSLF